MFVIKVIVGSFFITGGLVVMAIYDYNSTLQNCLREATEVARNSSEGEERHFIIPRRQKRI